MARLKFVIDINKISELLTEGWRGKPPIPILQTSMRSVVKNGLHLQHVSSIRGLEEDKGTKEIAPSEEEAADLIPAHKGPPPSDMVAISSRSSRSHAPTPRNVQQSLNPTPISTPRPSELQQCPKAMHRQLYSSLACGIALVAVPLAAVAAFRSRVGN